MQKPVFANLVRLQSASEIDMICFQAEALQEDEKHPFEEYRSNINGEICRELRIPDTFSRFITYNWHGFFDQQPWNSDKIPFDPTLINVIVPDTGKIIQIRGENRRVILTYPPTYQGERPVYHILFPSERDIDSIRVLNQDISQPFLGLERALTVNGFYKLPKLTNLKSAGFGIFEIDRQIVVVPENCKDFL